MTPTFYYTRKGSPEKIPAQSQTYAESYAEICGGEVFVDQLTSPLLFSSEESMSKSTEALTSRQELTREANYIDLLTKLAAFGPKIMLIWPLLLQIFTLIQEIAAKLAEQAAPAGGGLSIATTTVCIDGKELTAEVLAAEESLSQALTVPGSQSLFDFTLIRTAWALAKSSPQILAFLNVALDMLSKLFPKA